MPTQALCFVIMPFSADEDSDYDSEHWTEVYEDLFVPAIRRAEEVRQLSDLITNTMSDGERRWSMVGALGLDAQLRVHAAEDRVVQLVLDGVVYLEAHELV